MKKTQKSAGRKQASPSDPGALISIAVDVQHQTERANRRGGLSRRAISKLDVAFGSDVLVTL